MASHSKASKSGGSGLNLEFLAPPAQMYVNDYKSDHIASIVGDGNYFYMDGNGALHYFNGATGGTIWTKNADFAGIPSGFSPYFFYEDATHVWKFSYNAGISTANLSKITKVGGATSHYTLGGFTSNQAFTNTWAGMNLVVALVGTVFECTCNGYSFEMNSDSNTADVNEQPILINGVSVAGYGGSAGEYMSLDRTMIIDLMYATSAGYLLVSGVIDGRKFQINDYVMATVGQRPANFARLSPIAGKSVV